MSSNNRNYEFDPTFWQNGDSNNSVHSKILLSTIISFSIIILVVFAYYLYARFVLRRRRSSFQDLSIVSQPPKRGLNPLVIASLPTFVVKVNGDDVTAARECAVCLSLLEDKDTARMLPNCKHVFHVTCVDTWLTTQCTCPVCRTEVESSPRLEPEPREGPVGDGAAAPPPFDFTASSSDNKTGGSSVLRLDSVRRILTRERSLNRNSHSRIDQDRVLDLERQ